MTEENRFSSRMRGRAAALPAVLLVLLVAATFWRVGGYGFVDYDDGQYVSDNPVVRQGLTAAGAAWALTATEAANWHPLTWLSHMADVSLFGVDPGPHHAVNVLLHAANAVLLFLFLAGATGERGRSLLVAALFAVHPLHVESVAWISERKDLLSTFFVLLGLAAYARHCRKPSAPRYAAVALSFALALSAKPMVVTFPFLLLLLDWWPLRRPGAPVRVLVLEKVPLVAMSAALSLVTLSVQPRPEGIPFFTRAANAAAAYVAYVGKTLVPRGLAVFYPHPALNGSLGASDFLLGAGAALLLAAASVAAFRRRVDAPWLAVGWAWYLGTLVPAIGLVQAGGQAMADRYTYFPLVGLFIAFAWAVPPLAERLRIPGRATAVAAVVLVAVLSGLSWRQAGFWRSSRALYAHALESTGGNWVAEGGLGVAAFHEGRGDEALAHYREALRIWPGYSTARWNLGKLLLLKGQTGEALFEIGEALRLDPSLAGKMDAVRRMIPPPGPEEEALRAGREAAASGNPDEAAARFREAVRIAPDSPEAHKALAAALLRQGALPEAAEHFEAALRRQPGSADVRNNLGVALARMGKREAAIGRFREAVRIRPGYAEGCFNLGAALADAGNAAEARRWLAEALRFRPDYPEARERLKRLGG